MNTITGIWIGLALLPAPALAQIAAGAPSLAADGVVARHCRTAADCRAGVDKLLARPSPGATSALARSLAAAYCTAATRCFDSHASCPSTRNRSLSSPLS